MSATRPTWRDVGGMIEAHPRCTPSTRMSTNQIPGTPIMHHKLAFRRILPAVAHWTISSQTAQANMKNGSLKKNRN